MTTRRNNGSRATRSAIASLGALLLAMHPHAGRAEQVTVAVAANFLSPLQELKAQFEAATEHTLVLVSGSTGQLYAQIVNGAPFDVLLAADQERPRLLGEQAWGDSTSIFTYATGELALWSRAPSLVDEATLHALGEIDFRWLAIANPELAPYGLAARQTLEALGVWSAIEPRIVRGQNIAQTFALVETGNAELGLVALAQALAYEGEASYVIVPQELHDPIRQDAIVLRHGAEKPGARALVEFLRGPLAASIIERHGYAAGAN